MKNVLVIVDMQNDFVTGTLGSKAAQAIVPIVKELIEDFNGEVFFTLDTHDARYEQTQEGRKLPILHCLRDSDGWSVIDKLTDLLRERQACAIEKEGFGSSLLAESLREANKQEPIESITFAGLVTDICVLANAITVKTFLPETEIYVRSDACAGTTPEAHELALKAMSGLQINVI